MPDRRPGQEDLFAWPMCVFFGVQALTGAAALRSGYDTGFAVVVDIVMGVLAVGLAVVLVLGRRNGDLDRPTGFPRDIDVAIAVVWMLAGLLLGIAGVLGFFDARPGPLGGAISLCGGLALVLLGVRNLVRIVGSKP